ncbi:hypothetical protein CHUAL_007956 [Chamberlinius hualienensis]
MKWISTIVFIAFALFSCTSGSLLDDYAHLDLEDDLSIVTYIRLVLERFQSFFKNGIPEIDVAPKDPVYMGDYFQRWNNTPQVTDGTANIYNMTWRGLGGLTIDAVEFEVLNLLGNITLSFPVMDVTGSYSATGSVDGNSPTSATGDFDVHMTEAIFNVTLAFGIVNSTFTITELTLQFVIEKVEVIMSNLNGDSILEATLKQNAYDLYNHIYSAIQEKLESMSHSVQQSLDSIIQSEGEFNFQENQILTNLKKFAVDMGIPIF